MIMNTWYKGLHQRRKGTNVYVNSILIRTYDEFVKRVIDDVHVYACVPQGGGGLFGRQHGAYDAMDVHMPIYVVAIYNTWIANVSGTVPIRSLHKNVSASGMIRNHRRNASASG